MGLLAAFAVLALAPQDPTPTPAPTPNAAAVLSTQEERGDSADADVLAQLAQGEDAAVAARAAWALGRSKSAASLAALHTVASGSRHAEARLQAMNALANRAQADSAATALAALADTDARVRAEAARLLGAIKAAPATKILVAMIEQTAKLAPAAPSPDVPAALLALCDLGAAAQLLPVARALDGSQLTGAGPALQYYCQETLPTLPREQQLPVLEHLVAHREPAVREFALRKLASLGDAAALPWLEARVGVESGDLQTLAQQAIAVLAAPPPSDDPLVQGERNLRAISWRAASWWRHSDDAEKALALGVPAGALTLAIVVALLVRRRRAAAAATTAVAGAGAADAFAGTDEAAYDDATDYAEGDAVAEGEAADEHAEGAFADGEPTDGEYADGEYAEDGSTDEAPAEGDETAYAEVGAEDGEPAADAEQGADAWQGDAPSPR